MSILSEVTLDLEKIDNGFIATGHINGEEVKRFFSGSQDLMNRINGEFNQLVERLNRGERDWNKDGRLSLCFTVVDGREEG